LKVSRGVRLVDAPGVKTPRPNERVLVPLAGFIFASAPVLVGDTPQTATDEAIELTRDLVTDDSDLFALRVKGDSMIDAMVSDGDIVVMKKVDRARNGELVAVWLNDRSETTLKRFYLENGRVRLQPANPTMNPIYVDDPNTVEVQGKVVLVLRQMN
jgi:repressor LexA